MDIATGQSQDHPNVLPLNSEHSPAVVAATVREPVSTGPGDAGVQVTGVRDLTAERQELLSTSEAEWSQAISAGVAADGARRDHYAQTMSPLGASYGDQMPIPVVPSAALPPAMSDLYPYPGQEPAEASAGFEDPEYGT